jgi:pimeloyl-ACP methyl ester carboxylesterase
VADRLAGAFEFTVTAPDLRGHGKSPRADSYRIADFREDLMSLGTGWDLVVAHSLGGLIAARAAQTVDWTRRLILIDPALEFAAADLEQITQANVDEVVNPPSAADLQAANPRWDAEDARIKARAVREASATMTERTLRDNAPWRYAATTQSISVPTLILGADPHFDALFGPELGAAATANPYVRYKMVHGSGHSIHRDDPDAVLTAIRDWMV